ncbi:slr1601 family putative cell division protein [Aliterella atlantica]|uniref:Cell division protein FtsL n=1 Tax=Aliterella atlantica CENA595 TaxID=1618023 RepID=A0A0D8ZW57_9CYAN|nr:hypothetical protein [Aliterella atlantica]KJH71461.1 hypothetical protein UH38_13030 [Aliterella atlantica CENA595]
MHALRESRPPLEPRQTSRTPRRKVRKRVNANPYRVLALENTVKLFVNGLLIVGTASALVKLLPYSFSQQAKLQEITTEVNLTQNRVDNLQKDFKRNFDPQQAQKIMQEQSNRVAPGQRQVIILDKAASK